jgi:DDE superfamily endonuclease
MSHDELLDLYSDYLLSAFGQTTATGLSALLGGQVSHDQIQRFLADRQKTSADLWRIAKPHVRKIERKDAVMIVDDSIAEKPYTDENDIICWHYDHAKDRMVKGLNFMSALYHSAGASLPVGFELISKTEHYVDPKDGKEKRRSKIGKNELYQNLLTQALRNQISFKYVLNDVWFASADNMMFVKHDLKKHFVMPLKSNRKVALSLADKRHGRFVSVDTLDLQENAVQKIYLEGVDFLLLLVKQVFENEDGSTGIQYLVTSDTTLARDDILSLYRKRWNIEPYHKSLKQNASLEKSPTQTVVTQTNHFFGALCGYIKLELLKNSTSTNHFALKSKLYFSALQSAYLRLNSLQPVRLAA